MTTFTPPLYIDEQHDLCQRYYGLQRSLAAPPMCSSGHAFIAKDGGTLECFRCGFIPFGVLVEVEVKAANE